jgi:tRNA A-37 threonylcarbamoyl transferase component Bud32
MKDQRDIVKAQLGDVLIGDLRSMAESLAEISRCLHEVRESKDDLWREAAKGYAKELRQQSGRMERNISGLRVRVRQKIRANGISR